MEELHFYCENYDNAKRFYNVGISVKNKLNRILALNCKENIIPLTFEEYAFLHILVKDFFEDI